MNIGIIGYGLVGRACAIGFADVGHTVLVHDTKFDPTETGKLVPDTTLSRDVWILQETLEKIARSCEVIFICVPTPSKPDGSCNTQIVEQVVFNLVHSTRSDALIPIIAIKSTVTPGTTQKLADLFQTHRIAFVPEFLRERFSVQDFIEEHDLCVIGTESNDVFEKIKACHGNLPKQTVKVKPTEAEMVKYYNNVYNATLVTLGNAFYELCKSMKIDYSKIKDALSKRNHVSKIYLDCMEYLRGFSGPCLPKDLKAIIALCEKQSLNHVHFFDDLDRQNKKFIPTVFNGMREE